MLYIFLMCLAVTVFGVIYDEVVTKWFAQGMKVKMRYERGDYNGLEKLWWGLFVLGFVIIDLIGRNTVIVFRFRVLPKWELITDFIGDVTEHPGNYELWQVAIAVEYRVVIIEPIDPQHFRKRPNRAVQHVINEYMKISEICAKNHVKVAK